MRNNKRISFINVFLFWSLDQSLIQLSCNSEAFILQLFVIDVLRLCIDEVLQVVNLVFALLQFLFCCRVRCVLVVYLVLLLCYVYFIVWSRQCSLHFLLYLAQFLLLLRQLSLFLDQLVLELFHFLELIRYFVTHLFNVALQVLDLLSCSNLRIFQGPQIVQPDFILSFCLGCSVLTSVASDHRNVFPGRQLIGNFKDFRCLF